MTHEQAKIVLLEAELVQAHHTISFLHGCLTDEHYKYSYPDQTLRHLLDIEKLVAIPDGCFHSRHERDCPQCLDRRRRYELENEAKQVLGR